MKQIIIACLFLCFVSGCGSINNQILRDKEIIEKTKKEEQDWEDWKANQNGYIQKYKDIDNELRVKISNLNKLALGLIIKA